MRMDNNDDNNNSMGYYYLLINKVINKQKFYKITMPNRKCVIKM